MWKKDEMPVQGTAPRAEQPPQTERTPRPPASGERAAIGRSITIKGEVTGDEDLLIQGRVDGSVDLKQHAVTVGPEGEVKADIRGRIVTVEGKVEGNVSADEQIILRSAARVVGDIAAPRIVLEDGAQFRGGVDMGDTAQKGQRSGAGGSGAASGGGGGGGGGGQQGGRKAPEGSGAQREPARASAERAASGVKGSTDAEAEATP
jgi:cytoskeletal protein CcmA (bactofilin family)